MKTPKTLRTGLPLGGIGFLIVLAACQVEPGTVLPPPAVPSLEARFDQEALALRTTARQEFGGLKVRVVGDRTVVLEIRRDSLSRESRRLAVYRAQGLQWEYPEASGEVLTDFAIHPSGEISLAVEDTTKAQGSYGIVRLSPQGTVLAKQSLPTPHLPRSDLVGLAPQPFLMKSEPPGSYVDKWLPWFRLEPWGEHLVSAFLSYSLDASGNRGLASAVMVLDWSTEGYQERWSRLVDGLHSLMAITWQFDEFHWRDAATQPLLAVEGQTILVGRAFSLRRCSWASQVFQEIPLVDCRTMTSRNSPHRYQPFAVTRFTDQGARVGSWTWAPPLLEELVVFDMAVQGNRVALVGTAVRLGADGIAPLYPAEPGAPPTMNPYDGYVVVLDQEGTLVSETSVDLGRGEYFASVRWTASGLLAAGAADWDRWGGGMSLSRGAVPLLALVSLPQGTVRTRTLPGAVRDRHSHLLSVDTQGGTLVATGVSDAPMTHSGDVLGAPAMTFGGLTISLP